MDAGQWTMDPGLAAAVLAIGGLIALGVCWASLWGRHHEACRAEAGGRKREDGREQEDREAREAREEGP